MKSHGILFSKVKMVALLEPVTPYLPHILGPVCLFEYQLTFWGQVHVNISETLSNFGLQSSSI